MSWIHIETFMIDIAMNKRNNTKQRCSRETRSESYENCKSTCTRRDSILDTTTGKSGVTTIGIRMTRIPKSVSMILNPQNKIASIRKRRQRQIRYIHIHHFIKHHWFCMCKMTVSDGNRWVTLEVKLSSRNSCTLPWWPSTFFWYPS